MSTETCHAEQKTTPSRGMANVGEQYGVERARRVHGENTKSAKRGEVEGRAFVPTRADRSGESAPALTSLPLTRVRKSGSWRRVGEDARDNTVGGVGGKPFACWKNCGVRKSGQEAGSDNILSSLLCDVHFL